MVSVNDAMEHSNVSSFLQFAFCVLLFTYTLIARPEVLVKSMNGNKKKKIFWRRPEFPILSNLRSNHRFDVHRPFPPLICSLQTHKTTTAMTTRQFSGLLSIPNVWLGLSFLWFFLCNAKHLLLWAPKAVLLNNLYLQSRKWPIDNFQKSKKSGFESYVLAWVWG